MPATQPESNWTKLAPYPIPTGVAGPYVAAVDGDLIVAGGAAFPDAPPWKGGTKVFYSEMFALPAASTNPEAAWRKLESPLLRPAGYGVTVTSGNSVILIGGCDLTHCYSDVIEVTYRNHELGKEVRKLPSLPVPLGFITGAVVANKIFVAGGQSTIDGATATNSFFSLDLSARDSSDWKWTEEKSWPGSPRITAVSAAADGKYYLFSGRNVQPGKPTELLSDAYCFDPATGEWSTLPPVPHCVMAGEAIADARGSFIHLIGGDSGELFMKLEQLRTQIAAATGDGKNTLTTKLNEMLETHPGFGSEIIRFDPRQQTYNVIGDGGKPVPVTTSAVRIGSSILLPVGEVRPGIRSPNVWLGTLPR